MTMSIRTKLFGILSSLMLFFILLSLGFTHIGLEKFYIWQKKDILITSSTTIDGLYHGNPDEIALELEQIANTLGAGIMIFTKENSIKYSSFSQSVSKVLQLPSSSSPVIHQRYRNDRWSNHLGNRARSKSQN